MDNEDMINTLNNMIKSGKIPDNVKDMLQNFSNSNSQNNTSNSSTENTTNSQHENTNPSINPEMLSNMLKMLGQNQENNSNTSTNANFNSSNNNSNSSNSSIDMEMLLKMKNIMDKINSNQNDPRANLLISLKPYLKESRRNKVDQYARLFTMSKVMDLFNSNGGEMKK